MNTCDEYCIDSCSVINIVKGEALDAIRGFLCRPITIVETVLSEVSADLERQIEESFANNGFVACDAEIDVEEVQDLVINRNIGAGEAHAILACQVTGACLICDDKKARLTAVELLGEGRVIGSIGILCALLARQMLDVEQVMEMIHRMLAAGAFLPPVQQSYWDECAAGNSRIQ